MKLKRVLLAIAVLIGVASLAYVGQVTESSGAKMTVAAQKFLDSLSKEQKDKVSFAFEDKERFNWYFIPRQDSSKKSTRRGLPLEEMSAEQKEAARGLIRASTSMSGYNQATTIMSLESILHELEKPKGGTNVRNPEWYFFGVFGSPSKTGKWGWRVEGHHLALNFTIDAGKVIGSTPVFFGANPAIVKDGARKGLRTLPEAEVFARELVQSFDEAQKKVALHPEQMPDIEQAKQIHPHGDPKGLIAARMSDKQRDLLLKLIEGYANRLPADITEVELAQAKAAGLDKVHFAYWENPKKPGPYTYRVQGPTFVIEFLNVQADSAGNAANHIHSAWRHIKGDFGLASK